MFKHALVRDALYQSLLTEARNRTVVTEVPLEPLPIVREEYGERYRQRFEAKFFAAARKGAAEARRLFRDWETEVENGGAKRLRTDGYDT